MRDLSEQPIEVTKHLAAGKPAFIFFRLEGCPPCEATKKGWKDMADMLVDGKDDDVIIAKIESKLINDVKQKNGSTFDVRSFPDIKFINSKGHVTDYNGDRSATDLIKWVKENSSLVVVGEEPIRNKSPSSRRRRLTGGRHRKLSRRLSRSKRRSRRSRRSRRRSRTYRKY